MCANPFSSYTIVNAVVTQELLFAIVLMDNNMVIETSVGVGLSFLKLYLLLLNQRVYLAPP